MSKPYELPDDFAPPALSEIVPGLYQGRRPESYVPYDLVVSCEEHLAKKPMLGYSGVTVHLPMRDEDGFKITRAPVEIGILAAEFVLMGKMVLVHCTGGLNRSSLVTCWALVNIVNCSPKEAVALLRRKHDPYCLCNREFERWVTGEVLPTAETSAFRLAPGQGPTTEDYWDPLNGP